ncbi:MAG: nitrite reductase small subunit NirD [Myxacorys chilensis ATA2-1-KO14]|jgi:nitrite reductase (NADH) small subunit|nr:nitrite reductase small subunit NirD [Myxacorys chilensis ATA2-1-KO14]
MQAITNQSTATRWITVCALNDILPDTGVCALVNNQQVAIFRVGEELYAIANYDPFSNANVLSRGIVGDRNGIPKVASPVYKQNFNLATGECLDNAEISVPTFSVRVMDQQVQVGATQI